MYSTWCVLSGFLFSCLFFRFGVTSWSVSPMFSLILADFDLFLNNDSYQVICVTLLVTASPRHVLFLLFEVRVSKIT